MFSHDEEVPEELIHHPSYRIFVEENKRIRRRYLRTLVSFFIFGICNNLNFVVLLTAARDILSHNSNYNDARDYAGPRKCTELSTGLVLFTNIVTSVAVSLFIPFCPIMICSRITSSVVMTIFGYLSIASAVNSLTIAIIGLILVSAAVVIGEATFLQYTSYFHGNVLSCWSIGTGVAGLVGALMYTLGAKYNYKYTMYGMVSVPILMALIFWVLLPIPTEQDKQSVSVQRAWNESEVKTPWSVLKKKYRLVPKVLYKYITPLGLVYLFEYFINQGTYELIESKTSLIKPEYQYHWLQIAYQTGVFISRSSVNCIYIKYIWVMAVLQFLNVVIFTTNAIYWYIESFWVLFALAIEEGLLAGAAYVNTFVRIGKEEEEEEKQFMSSMTCFGNNAGILLAGSFSILAHNLICKLPHPSDM